MNIFVDIDGTLTQPHEYGGDYERARGKSSAVAAINRAYAAGHHVVLWTARGTGSGLDWRALTERQLREWGVRYHELRFGKPMFDLFIDDKALSAGDWEARDYPMPAADEGS